MSNRIFEMRMLNLFITEESLDNTVFNQGERDIQFVEEHGRKFFLLYLKAIINDTGNYYLEAQT